MRGAKAVAIQINSPGGSAVQSMLIYKRIRALADEKGLKVYVFAEDVAASGGYLLALAGDEIYADPSSIVGSIGVITATFGLNELIDKIGVERRVYTAGDSKDTLDPFLPEKPEDVERIKSLQRDVHATFIDLVKERRGAKIDKRRRGSVHRRVLVRQDGARARPDRRPLRSPQQDARALRRGRAPQAGACRRPRGSAASGASSPRPAVSTSASHLAGLPPISSRRSRRARSGRASGSEPCRQSFFCSPPAPGCSSPDAGMRLSGSASPPSSRRRGGARAARAESVDPLERDPATGVYRPKQTAGRVARYRSP